MSVASPPPLFRLFNQSKKGPFRFRSSKFISTQSLRARAPFFSFQFSMKHAAAALFTHHWRRSDVVSLTRLEVLQARLFSTRSQITGRSNRMLRKLRNGQRERARGSYARATSLGTVLLSWALQEWKHAWAGTDLAGQHRGCEERAPRREPAAGGVYLKSYAACLANHDACRALFGLPWKLWLRPP